MDRCAARPRLRCRNAAVGADTAQPDDLVRCKRDVARHDRRCRAVHPNSCAECITARITARIMALDLAPKSLRLFAARASSRTTGVCVCVCACMHACVRACVYARWVQTGSYRCCTDSTASSKCARPCLTCATRAKWDRPVPDTAQRDGPSARLARRLYLLCCAAADARRRCGGDGARLRALHAVRVRRAAPALRRQL